MLRVSSMLDMSQRYNDITKRPKPKENQLGILKIYVLYRKIQQKTSDSGDSTARVTYLSWFKEGCCWSVVGA